MHNEPLLDNKSKEEIKKDLSEKYRKNKIIDNTQYDMKKAYEKYDVYHKANFFSKIFFCWVNKALAVKIYYFNIVLS